MLVYLPKLIDSVKMIVYGIKNKNYYWDKKWYGIKYYDKNNFMMIWSDNEENILAHLFTCFLDFLFYRIYDTFRQRL